MFGALRGLLLSVLTVAVLFAAYAAYFHFTVDTSDYNYENFAASQYPFGRFDGPTVGQRATNFSVMGLDGEEVTLASFKGEYLVLETGSLTCPQYVSRIEAMKHIVADHPDIEFATLYVREAHPGSKIPPHRSFTDKLALAKRLQTEEGETRTLLIDDLSGTAHNSYGAWPNMVYIIDPDGVVAFRGLWNNPGVVSEALTRLRAGESVADLDTGVAPNEMAVTRRVLGRAGGHAITDFVAGVPVAAVGHVYESLAGVE